MWRLRVVPLLTVAAWFGFDKSSPRRPAAQQQRDVTPIVVVSGSDRRWASTVGLIVIVRDVDQPDTSISDVRIVLERASVRDANPIYAASDSAGRTSLAAPDSGDYRVRIHRIGYAPLYVRARLEVKCHQMLEAYVARSVGLLERPTYTVGREPKEFRAVIETGGRAVLTTCAAPLPNAR